MRAARGPALLLVVAVLGAVVAVTVTGRDGGPPPAAAPAPAPAGDPAVVANPLVAGSSRNPAVLRAADGTFFAYLDGVDLGGPLHVVALRSDDLTTWTMVGDVLEAPGAWADPSSGARFTSPSVRHVPANPPPARYVMYLSAPTADGAATCIGVATAPAPEGPFVGADQPLICPPGGARAASPVPGADQVVYRAETPTPGIYGLVLDPTGTAIAPGAAPVLLLGAAGGVGHEGVLERPAVARDGDSVAYLFARTGGPAGGVGWSPCRSAGTVVTTCADRTHLGSWLAPTGPVAAIGGLQVFTDGDGAAWIAYDARPAASCVGTTCTGIPTFRVDRLCFAHGEPRTDGPTVGPRPVTRSPDCAVDVPGVPLGVTAVDDTGRVERAPEVTLRDGASAVPVGGRLLWLFGEAYIDPATGGPGEPCAGVGGSVPNSAAWGVPDPAAVHPGAAVPLRRDGPDGPCTSTFVPLLEHELRFNRERSGTGPRVVVWERGGIPLDDGSALVFFALGIQDRGAPGAATGCSYCIVGPLLQGAVRVGPGQVVADRASTAVGCAPTCLFGPEDGSWSGWPFVADGHVYLYDEDPGGAIRLGRAPLAAVEDRSAWRFRTAEGEWSPAIADAAPVPGLFRPPVGVSYNGHLDRFVTVVNTAEDVVALQTARDPWGPWSDPIPFYDWSDVECATVAASTPRAVPWLDDAGGRVVRFTFTRGGAHFGRDPACPGETRLVTVTLR